MYYLLSTNTAGGAVAPYLYANTTHIDYACELININTIAAYVTVIVSIQPTFSGMTQSQLAEQRGAVQVFVPASQAILPIKIRGRYSVAEVAGVSESEVLSNQNYRQLSQSLPGIPIYLHLVVASVDGSTSCAMQVKQTFDFTTRFMQINNFVTTVPI